MSKRTDKAYAELHRSRDGFKRLLDEFATTDGTLDPRDAERLYDGLSGLLNEALGRVRPRHGG